MVEPPFFRIKLLQLPDNVFYHRIANLILSFAVIGQTDVATRLLSKLNQHDSLHGQQLLLRPLWFLWDTLGTWPEGEKARLYDMIQRDRRDGKANAEDVAPVRKSARLNKESESAISDEQVRKQLERLAQEYREGWWYPAKKYGKASPHTQQLSSQEKRQVAKVTWNAVEGMEPGAFTRSQTGALAIDASSALVSTLDLVLDVESHSASVDPAPSSKDILDEISKHMNANMRIQKLAESRRAWGILKDGALGKALNLDDDKVHAFVHQVENVLDERFRDGRMVPQDMPMRKLLEQIEHNGFHLPDPEDHAPLDPEFEKTFFRKPVAASEITDVEKRLAVDLPDDYKEFLKVSNGFGPLYNGVIFNPPLLKVEEVRWLTDEEDYFTDLHFDPLDDTGVASSDVTVGKAIEIGKHDIYNTWLIPPSKTDEYKEYVRKTLDHRSSNVSEERKKKMRQQIQSFAGSEEVFWSMEWMCVVWASGGSASMFSYPSFKGYLARMAEEVYKDVDFTSRGEGELLTRGKWWGYSFVKSAEEA
ncbi:ribosome-recycling factor [Kalmusia sp. IMI 367209]|nr:ribosome-recycling factor [Kalmusia sp. IMI 367209]